MGTMAPFPPIELFEAGKPLQPDWKLENFFELTAHEESAPLKRTHLVSAGRMNLQTV